MRVSSAERLVKSDTLASRTSRSRAEPPGHQLWQDSGCELRAQLCAQAFHSACFAVCQHVLRQVMLLGSEALPVLHDQGDIILE